MKKTILFKIRKRLGRALGAAAAAMAVAVCAALPVFDNALMAFAEEETVNQTVTYVYHQHIGNGGEEGGCYQSSVYHVHTGGETAYGGCYETPVYHAHEGDETSGGGCYGIPVLHVHSGSAEDGSGCYTSAVLHQSHTGTCWKSVSSTELDCYEVSVQETGEYDGSGNPVYLYYMSCGTVVKSASSQHVHSVEQCVGLGGVEGYELGCGKDEETVEGYELNCGKDETVIEYYAVSCSKTTEDIEGYALSCGKDETTPYGRIVLTEEKTDDPERARITVTFEDLTDGSLQLTEDPYAWYDEQGNALGTGDAIEVSENGSYTVKVSLVNEDVDKDRLTGTIGVDSITETKQEDAPTATPTATPGAGDTSTAAPTPSADASSEAEGTDSGEDTSPEASASPSEAGEVRATATPTKTPESSMAAGDASQDGPDDPDGTGGLEGAGGYRERTDDGLNSRETEELQEQKQEAAVPELQSENQETAEKKETRKKTNPAAAFFSSPAVQAVSITAGALAALLGLFLLLYYLCKSVRLYNDDGEGRLFYLGRCDVCLKEEGYVLEVPASLEEKAVTNRYCIKPGLFLLLKSSEEEMIVCRQEKRVSVHLSREMIVVI